MIKLPLHHPPFPPLHLMDSDKDTVISLVDTILTEARDEFEKHLHCNNGVIQTTHWAQVKQIKDVVVYQDRKAHKTR
ncbi:unnamed protein product [Peronospora belbahrii]|uniref:Uncharacterized protein n=1 Tax=Peronospora belbahrii TaxID=622444 RepID=A0AAU9LCY3_9STRA|nr:unnamed protein product [Peronospora belbahrii]CAH0513893.1 unnamed protein product [Peronospora belbahrii]